MKALLDEPALMQKSMTDLSDSKHITIRDEFAWKGRFLIKVCSNVESPAFPNVESGGRSWTGMLSSREGLAEEQLVPIRHVMNNAAFQRLIVCVHHSWWCQQVTKGLGLMKHHNLHIYAGASSKLYYAFPACKACSTCWKATRWQPKMKLLKKRNRTAIWGSVYLSYSAKRQKDVNQLELQTLYQKWLYPLYIAVTAKRVSVYDIIVTDDAVETFRILRRDPMSIKCLSCYSYFSKVSVILLLYPYSLYFNHIETDKYKMQGQCERVRTTTQNNIFQYWFWEGRLRSLFCSQSCRLLLAMVAHHPSNHSTTCLLGVAAWQPLQVQPYAH